MPRVLHAMRERETEAIEESTARAEGALRDVKVQQRRLLNLLVEGVVSREDYDTKRRELEGRRTDETLTMATAALAHGEKFDRATACLAALVDADKTFERSTAEERQVLLRLFGFEFKTDGEKVLVEAQKPAAAVIASREFQEWWRLWTDIIPFSVQNSP